MKIIRIITSRFKKEEEFVQNRRSICEGCVFNSNNTNRTSLRDKLYKVMSDILNWILMRESEDLGQCIHPDCGCDIYYKTLTEEEFCHAGNWDIKQ